MPSKAALELARVLTVNGFIRSGAHPADVGTVIQSALGDLLEKAQKVVDAYIEPDGVTWYAVDPLEKALEPWREKTDDTPKKSA